MFYADLEADLENGVPGHIRGFEDSGPILKRFPPGLPVKQAIKTKPVNLIILDN